MKMVPVLSLAMLLAACGVSSFAQSPEVTEVPPDSAFGKGVSRFTPVLVWGVENISTTVDAKPSHLHDLGITVDQVTDVVDTALGSRGIRAVSVREGVQDIKTYGQLNVALNVAYAGNRVVAVNTSVSLSRYSRLTHEPQTATAAIVWINGGIIGNPDANFLLHSIEQLTQKLGDDVLAADRNLKKFEADNG